MEKYIEVYNRYAHIDVVINKEKTIFTLVQPDLFKLEITPQDLCKLNVDYVISQADISEYNIKNKISFKEVYNEDGFIINRLTCDI